MTTPARNQYLRIKKEHRNEILLFRMGDFYETFDDDAFLVAKELEIALTSREMGKGQRIPLAGIPYHALDGYLAKLIRKGHRVAICEQITSPTSSKEIIEREVVRVVTPGTFLETGFLEHDTNNYLAAVFLKEQTVGLAYVDITTLEFATSQFDISQLDMELNRLSPTETLVPEAQRRISILDPASVTTLKLEIFEPVRARKLLLDHFRVLSLEAYGCETLSLAVSAAGAILDYLSRNQSGVIRQLTSLVTYSTSNYMTLDEQTGRNLELFTGGRWGKSEYSLFAILNQTKTPMGSRQLRRWIGQPLLDLEAIEKRLNTVTWFNRDSIRLKKITEYLKSVSDIERVIARITGHRATPRDLIGLATSLEVTSLIKEIFQNCDDHEPIAWLLDQIEDKSDVTKLIRDAIVDEPVIALGEGQVIKIGFSSTLDLARSAARDAQDHIANMENIERERTGIKSLKIGFNKNFGYYIEISRANLSKVPENYIRRQTLVGGERFIIPTMKEYEAKILRAKEEIKDLETELFDQICKQVAEDAKDITSIAYAIALADVLASLAAVALSHGYVKPQLNNGDILNIENGRHPVVEMMLPTGAYVPNDTNLSNNKDQLVILTGPNMSGKSTYLRQIAVITLMAQIGSYVPATSVSMGLVDRIFTRVGLQDDVTLGQSTFMVEMLDTASILNHATPKSLILLDEIGRGTSTYDGLSIAQAVVEYIHNHPQMGCKTLFATHYHELIDLENHLPRLRNFHVSVAESNGKLNFLHKVISGGADRSYGVQVAELSGLPISVVRRAWEVLRELECRATKLEDEVRADTQSEVPEQLSFRKNNQLVLKELLELDVSSITPLEAINKLYMLQMNVRDV